MHTNKKANGIQTPNTKGKIHINMVSLFLDVYKTMSSNICKKALNHVTIHNIDTFGTRGI